MSLALGIDIGGTNVKAGLVSDDARILASKSIPTRMGGEPHGLVSDIATLAKVLMEEAGNPAVRGAGISVAGFLDPDHATMTYNANLPDLAGFPLRNALSEAMAMPCALEVDSNAAALAEYYFGAARGSGRLLYITLGTGVGGGIIVEGELLRYCGECAGDVGHIIVDPGGRSCTCGARGCLEALVCGSAIHEKGKGQSVAGLINAALEDDIFALDIFRETGRWLGLGLASLAHIYAPDRIVIGGGISAAGEALLGPAREHFVRECSPHFSKGVTIAAAHFTGTEGMVGAAIPFLTTKTK